MKKISKHNNSDDVIICDDSYEPRTIQDTKDNNFYNKSLNMSNQLDTNGLTMQHEMQQHTEMGDALKEINDDSINSQTKMSGIDMRSRLSGRDISAILIFDTLVSFGLFPEKSVNLTRQKKRLVVSLAGLGRQEIVKIVGGYKEHEERKSNMTVSEKLGSVFGVGKD